MPAAVHRAMPITCLGMCAQKQLLQVAEAVLQVQVEAQTKLCGKAGDILEAVTPASGRLSSTWGQHWPSRCAAVPQAG